MTKNKTDDMQKPKCGICLKYTDKKTQPQCMGHGVSGGGSGGGSSETAAYDDAKSITKILGTMTAAQLKDIMLSSKHHAFVEQDAQRHQADFNPEVISDLINQKLLLIEDDKENGRLSISLQCYPQKLTDKQREELKKFVNAILNVMHAFKKENGIQTDCYKLTTDKVGNFLTLKISFSTPALYDAFIQRLQNMQLLPTHNNQQNRFNPTPLSTKPSPTGKKKVDDEVTSDSDSKKSPLRLKSPLDGLKPTGWN